MKTAVEWLMEELSLKSKALKIMLNAHKEIVEQAKAIEKEQMKDAWDNGCGYLQENSQQYYNETFKSE